MVINKSERKRKGKKTQPNTQYPIPNTTPLLQVSDLTVRFPTAEGTLTAVDSISYSVRRGEFVAMLGESGCGKSVSALSLLGIVQAPGRIEGGSVRMQGRELVGLSNEELRRVRGKEIAMIFQEPMTSLNPLYRVGDQISEGVTLHHGLGREEALALAVDYLGRMGLSDPKLSARSYPHELSGGMRQRAMIAMALSCRPKLLLADEPTTALDVTIQSQILGLLVETQRKEGLSVLLITHDIGVVHETSKRVLVMYTGRIVEEAPTKELFCNPLHPYTIGLLASVPDVKKAGKPLPTIKGEVPNMLALPSGCHFRARCPRAVKACAELRPELRVVGRGRKVACIRA